MALGGSAQATGVDKEVCQPHAFPAFLASPIPARGKRRPSLCRSLQPPPVISTSASKNPLKLTYVAPSHTAQPFTPVKPIRDACAISSADRNALPAKHPDESSAQPSYKRRSRIRFQKRRHQAGGRIGASCSSCMPASPLCIRLCQDPEYAHSFKNRTGPPLRTPCRTRLRR